MKRYGQFLSNLVGRKAANEEIGVRSGGNVTLVLLRLAIQEVRVPESFAADPVGNSDRQGRRLRPFKSISSPRESDSWHLMARLWDPSGHRVFGLFLRHAGLNNQVDAFGITAQLVFSPGPQVLQDPFVQAGGHGLDINQFACNQRVSPFR